MDSDNQPDAAQADATPPEASDATSAADGGATSEAPSDDNVTSDAPQTPIGQDGGETTAAKSPSPSGSSQALSEADTAETDGVSTTGELDEHLSATTFDKVICTLNIGAICLLRDTVYSTSYIHCYIEIVVILFVKIGRLTCVIHYFLSE